MPADRAQFRPGLAAALVPAPSGGGPRRDPRSDPARARAGRVLRQAPARNRDRDGAIACGRGAQALASRVGKVADADEGARTGLIGDFAHPTIVPRASRAGRADARRAGADRGRKTRALRALSRLRARSRDWHPSDRGPDARNGAGRPNRARPRIAGASGRPRSRAPAPAVRRRRRAARAAWSRGTPKSPARARADRRSLRPYLARACDRRCRGRCRHGRARARDPAAPACRDGHGRARTAPDARHKAAPRRAPGSQSRAATSANRRQRPRDPRVWREARRPSAASLRSKLVGPTAWPRRGNSAWELVSPRSREPRSPGCASPDFAGLNNSLSENIRATVETDERQFARSGGWKTRLELPCSGHNSRRCKPDDPSLPYLAPALADAPAARALPRTGSRLDRA